MKKCSMKNGSCVPLDAEPPVPCMGWPACHGKTLICACVSVLPRGAARW